MQAQRVNGLSGSAVILLSLTALLTVLTGYFQQPQNDEGTAAHIFQLSIVMLVPLIVVFIFTSDWQHPVGNVKVLLFATALLVLAFGSLYYLEHVFYPERVRRAPSTTGIAAQNMATTLCVLSDGPVSISN